MSRPPDAMLRHLQMTLQMTWSAPPAPLAQRLAHAPPRSAPNDEQERFLFGVDLPMHLDDEGRAQRFIDALALTRRAADGHDAMSWTLLAEIISQLLGREAEFRNGDAFAHDGEHRYGWWPELEAMFARKLEADCHDGLHVALQIARGYLDLIYIHPFEDGNARAARLLVEYLSRRAQVATPSVGALIQACPAPGDLAATWDFVEVCLDSIQSRGRSHQH